MTLKFRTLLAFLPIVLLACEPEKIEPTIDCTASNLEVEVISIVNSDCDTNNGSITVSGTGGKSPYHFSINNINFVTDSVFTGLASNNYTITIRDANECTNVIQTTVNNAAGFEVETITVASNCAANDGSITVTPVGGEAPFTYKIGNGGFGDSPVFDELAAGNYTITAKDANGCQTIAQVSISNAVSIELSATKQEAGCGTSNGSLTLAVEGGSAPYQYRIGNGSFGANNVFNGLAAGNHTITAKDANGCEDTKTEKVLSGIKFSTTIGAIISSNCATSNCHGGSQTPNLNSFASIQANAEAIKSATANKTMPKNGTLTQAQIDAIACWVNDGAPNN